MGDTAIAEPSSSDDVDPARRAPKSGAGGCLVVMGRLGRAVLAGAEGDSFGRWRGPDIGCDKAMVSMANVAGSAATHGISNRDRRGRIS